MVGTLQRNDLLPSRDGVVAPKVILDANPKDLATTAAKQSLLAEEATRDWVKDQQNTGEFLLRAQTSSARGASTSEGRS